MLVLLALFLATAYPYVASVKAQNQATVNVLESIGGSTDPLPGTYSYNGGTQVTLTATPDENLVFVSWLISTDASNDTATDNPYTLTVTEGVTYTVATVFAQLTPTPTFPNPQPPTPTTYGAVSILQAVGGRTQPAEGTYFFSSVFNLKLTAIASSGWKFSHWVISGDTNTTHGGYPFTLTPTDNPYTFNCGLGYTYSYQPVFVPVTSTNPPPTTAGGGGMSTETIIIIAVIAVIVVAFVSAFAGYSYSKRRK
jgi:hypothetical protein